MSAKDRHNVGFEPTIPVALEPILIRGAENDNTVSTSGGRSPQDHLMNFDEAVRKPRPPICILHHHITAFLSVLVCVSTTTAGTDSENLFEFINMKFKI